MLIRNNAFLESIQMNFDVHRSQLKWLAALLILLCIGRPLSAQILNPDRDLEIAGQELIWAQTLKGKHFNEIWNYHFYLNDGLTVHIIFSVVDFGSLKSPVSGVKVSVVNFEGKTYQLTREYSLDKLLQDRENFVFRPNPERELYFRGDLSDELTVRIRTSKNGNLYDIELHLTNIAQSLKLGNGMYHVDGEDIGIITHIPYAEVSGYVAMNNNRAHVFGTAYMDHTFQNERTTKLMDSGYRFVHHQNADNWDLVYFMLPNNSSNNQTIGHRIVNHNGDISSQIVNRMIQKVESDAFGKDIARILEVDVDEGQPIRILRTEDHEKFSIFDELGWPARQVARSFLGGEVIEFRGEGLLMELSHKPKKGFYNYFLVD